MVAVTNMHNPNDTSAKGCSYAPKIASTAMSATPAMVGIRNARFRLSSELLRQAISGPMPVRKISARPIGMLMRLKNGASTLIFSPVTASEITGNMVPHSTAKQLATRIRLLNMKLDSRDTTLSRRASLFRYFKRSRIRITVAAIPTARNITKYLPMGDCAKACTELTTPERVRNVPKMHRKKVPEIRTMFQTFIMPFFSCIITECRNAVAVIQGSSDAFSTGSQAQYPPQPSTAYAQPCPSRMPALWNSHVTMVQRLVV